MVEEPAKKIIHTQGHSFIAFFISPLKINYVNNPNPRLTLISVCYI